MNSKLLFQDNEWSFDTLDRTMSVLSELAKELALDTYPNQIEIISSEQMLDAYASVGLPVMYRHWSFGKTFSRERDLYRSGKRGLAYEIVINLNPCINYLMEENSATMQTLVLAHAAFGHNHFFKNNYLFKMWTDASSIMDYLIFARNYIAECESKYGLQKVEAVLDSAHALQQYGVDRYKRPRRVSLHQEKQRQRQREEYLQTQVNELWGRTVKQTAETVKENTVFPEHPEENILYFLEKHSPVLETWQREILRIVRKINQYFYPQGQTKVMNEGWASFTHHYLMNRLWEEGYIDDGSMLEFVSAHTNVLYQPSYNSPHYSGLNPYYLGFEIFTDIKRMCQHPDEEDHCAFPQLAGQPWRETLLDAVANFRDESFIRQYLGPKVIRKMRLFTLHDSKHQDHYLVRSIHDEDGYRSIRNALAEKYEIDEYVPKLEVIRADVKGDRTLTLLYQPKRGRKLNSDTDAVLTHMMRLWGYDVEIVDESGDILHQRTKSS
jgi:stage V sporulation protein R